MRWPSHLLSSIGLTVFPRPTVYSFPDMKVLLRKWVSAQMPDPEEMTTINGVAVSPNGKWLVRPFQPSDGCELNPKGLVLIQQGHGWRLAIGVRV